MNHLYLDNNYSDYRENPHTDFAVENDEDRFALPLLAGLALTAPFWAGRRCCPIQPYPYPAPYPLPYPYPYPYPNPSPYYFYYGRPFIY